MAALVRYAARPQPALRRMYASAAQNLVWPEAKVTTLPNGMKVATRTIPNKIVSVGYYVNSGSRAETPETNGCAHFLEHMCFKGNSKRTMAKIEFEIENMGASLDAYTSRETTSYTGRCLKGDTEKVVSILHDCLTDSTFDESMFEAERKTILREEADIGHQKEEAIQDYLHQVAFPDSSMGMTILGSRENIKSLPRQTVLDFVKNHYTTHNITLVAVGDIEHEELVKIAEQNCNFSTDAAPVEKEKPTFVGADVRLRNDLEPDAYVAIAVEGPPPSHDDYIPALILNSIVGSWDQSLGGGANLASPFAQTVANGSLAHSYQSLFTSYSDVSLWGMQARTSPETLEDFVWELQAEWMRLCTSPTDAEVERAKRRLIADNLFKLEDNNYAMDLLGTQLIQVGREISPAEQIAQIEAVTTADVKRVANDWVFDKCPAVAATGPVEGLQDYNRLRSGMFWLRV